MEDNNIRNQLLIKPVGVKYLDQYDELMRYVFQVTSRQEAESGYKGNELTRSKRPVLQQAEVFGWFTPEDELISMISIYPCKVNIHGVIMEMGGVTGVGTYPEYANLGLMNDLIKLALKKMKDNGQLISYLYPYSIPYYRRKGWEIMSDSMTFTLNDSQLPSRTDVPGHVERLDVDDEDVINLYNEFAQTNHGALIRDKFQWTEYWRWENEDERTAAVYYDANGVPKGFVFYWVEDDVFHIKEMIYLTQEARRGLWNFIGAHFSMIDQVKGETFKNEPIAFTLEDSHVVETLEPYYMARIVDVKSFLEVYPFADTLQPFHFVVTDPIASWNNAVFGVFTDENGKTVVTEEALGSAVKLDIGTLSTMLMSYRRPAYLHKIERLTTDRKTLKLLEKIIPDQQPYFSDYF